ncbi:hypothetical protein B0H17DRAFT_1199489 [Mycena rosella]|uniref:Uncharacterized protein n=1 Tax=Mycena rosella TaxID=1033263 RepID=A0AAD7DML0_MYCRO|nr:hypothetical protein B0H17DRAFT_1199489 [Mycena rosella]
MGNLLRIWKKSPKWTKVLSINTKGTICRLGKILPRTLVDVCLASRSDPAKLDRGDLVAATGEGREPEPEEPATRPMTVATMRVLMENPTLWEGGTYTLLVELADRLRVAAAPLRPSVEAELVVATVEEMAGTEEEAAAMEAGEMAVATGTAAEEATATPIRPPELPTAIWSRRSS